MKILSSQQMRELDRRVIEELGIIGPILMENAGLGITREIISRFPSFEQEKIVIVAGKGNNGGDGFVVARHLFNHGYRPEVLLLAEKTALVGDAGINLTIIDRIGVPVFELPTLEHWEREKHRLDTATVAVDAIFGTGLTKPAGGLYARVIEDFNQIKAYKVAVDIPSGLSSDSFLLIGPCVKADLTVTMAAPKIAHVFQPSEEYIGELVVADISMPPFIYDDDALKLEMVEKSMIMPYFRHREKDTHKGTYGHLMIVSGSMGKTGAAIMAGQAALKMGAGLVTVGTPRSCLPIIARSMMELMTEPLEETSGWTLSESSLEQILTLMEGKDALLIGPGISTQESTSNLVLNLLPEIKAPMVIDADALNILANKPEVLKSLSQPAVLTPHPGEFARLLDMNTKQVVKEKLELAPRFSQEFGVYLVLKGYRTLISTPDGRVYINPTGNPGMATGGSGDVLSGMIGALVIREQNLLGAVLAAVYLHGLSGDIAAREVGEAPLIAGNLINSLPAAFKSLET